tara:strand:+ start:337 stop:513 length:177 start_codon:yes stop_codon:yes gene_type:complete
VDIEQLVQYLREEYDSNTADADKYKSDETALGKSQFTYYAARAEQIEDILNKMKMGVG